jgi:hypothetical protein
VINHCSSIVRSFSAAALTSSISLASPAAQAHERGPTEPAVSVTWPWMLTQLVPSPEVVYGEHTARFGLRWQVTPLLFSWGIHRGLSPWRLFVVEPNVRHFGSMELYVTPELVTSAASVGAATIFRSGFRAYFPLVEHGEYLSCSVGASQFFYDARSAAGYEVGLYTLFGILGLQVTASPQFAPMATSFTLSVRYF